MEEKDIKYWIWFSRIEKLTCIQKEKLLKKFKSPKNIWDLDKYELQELCHENNEKIIINENSINDIYDSKYKENLEKYEEYIKKNNIKIITIFDNIYPSKLRNMYDKPAILFAKGNIKLLKMNSVAIVGCRKCSLYGAKIAQKIGYELSKENICVISGFAKGIDKFSHIGALEAKGNTIAVIGCGLDYIYPYENKNLYERIINNNGLIITEYIIGTKPDKMNFPARNRIISGLSDGIVVVEAQEKSGALITSDFGLEQGKEIFAVPGNIDNYNSVGTNELIRDGANMVTSYEDIINVLYKK